MFLPWEVFLPSNNRRSPASHYWKTYGVHSSPTCWMVCLRSRRSQFSFTRTDISISEHPSTEWKTLQLKPVINLNNRRPEFIYSFEVKSGKALPEVKFYLPIRFYNATDAATVTKLSNFFELRGWHEMAKSYKYALQEIL